MGQELRFLLNDTEIRLTEAGARDTLLDFLRLNRRMTGTKEGCAEGDCGACTVLAGRLTATGLVYEPVNACIRLLASCHATHIVTIEHLRGAPAPKWRCTTPSNGAATAPFLLPPPPP